MLNKRGQEEFITELLMELLIGALMVIALMWYANRATNPTVIDKEYLAKDFGLSTAFVQGMPYPVMISFMPFQADLKKYNVKWDTNLISVSLGKDDKYPEVQFYLRDTAIFKFMTEISDNYIVHFINNRNQLVINPSIAGTQMVEYNCDVPLGQYNAIFIDPAHGEEEDTGESFSYSSASTVYRESNLACKIAGDASARIIDEKTVLSSRAVVDNLISCEGKRIDEMQIAADVNSKADMILSIHTGNYPTDGNLIKAYVEQHKDAGRDENIAKIDNDAMAVACRLLNSLSKATGADTALIPVDIETYDLRKEYPMLGRKKVPTIILEIGSLSSIRTRRMLETPGPLGEAIAGVLNG